MHPIKVGNKIDVVNHCSYVDSGNLAAMSYVHEYRKLSYPGLPSGQGESEGGGDRSEGLRGQG